MTAAPLASPHVFLVTSEYMDLQIGGLGTYTDMLAAYLRGRFAHLHVVEIPYASRAPVSERRGRFGEQIVRAPFPNFLLKLDTQYDPKLEEVYQRLPLDEPLLIIGNESYGAYVGARIRAAARSTACLVYVPHVFATLMSLHGYAGERFQEALQTAHPQTVPGIMKDVELLAGADFVLFISRYMRAYAKQHLDGDPARHGIVGHYVESPPVVKSRYADEVRNVIFTGRLELQKGLHDVFESLEDVLRCLPKATFHIYGSGGLGTVLKWRSRPFGDRVVFHGYKPRAEILRVLPDMDLAILPSIYEPFGYSVLESMAAGVPIIASDVGGLGELTSWLPEGLRLHATEGLSPLFGDTAMFGTRIPGKEILRVLSYAAAHPEVLAETGRQGAALARERHNRQRYTEQMDVFIDGTLRWLAERGRSGLPDAATAP
jgi:glycosyltransferase involved in cell wall biosynthesis